MIKNSKTHHKSRDRGNDNRHHQQHVLDNLTSQHPVDWFLVLKTGTIAFKLNPFCVILIGSEQCDINIQSPSVEKRHAVLCFDPNSDRFSVKDLNSTNGTFLNNRRISSDRPERLNNMDLLRFGYDSNLYELRLGSASGPGVQQNEQRNVTYSPTTSDTGFSAGGTTPERFSHVMQQSGRGNSLYGSRVSSPSLTLDSGRGSSSAPSSPAKEMSPVSNLASSNLQASPTFSGKVTKPEPQQESVSSSHQKVNNVGGSGDSRMTYSAKNLSKTRKTSLDDEISNAVDQIMFPQNVRSSSRASSSSAVHNSNSLEADLNVPNEIFDDHHDPKHREMGSSEGSTSFKQDGMSRPRSFSGGSLNGIAPSSNAPSPLYGTPHWWPQDENYSPNEDNDDEHDEPTSVSQIIREDEINTSESNIMEQLGINSDGNRSGESDSQSDRAPTEDKKYEPMAFTVDFDDGPKKFGITEPISKFVPRHRRNLSSTKTDDLSSKKETDDSSKKEARSLPVGVIRLGSSNQVNESDIKANTLKNSRIAKPSSETRPNSLVEKVKKLPSELSSKLSRDKPTPPSSLFSSRQNPTGLSEIRKSDLLVKDIPKSKTMSKSDNKIPKPPVKAALTEIKPTPFMDMDKEDASSETGTYTIEKDAPDVEKARKNIDDVFGMDVKKCDKIPSTAATYEPEHNVDLGAPEWIREWAEQAAQQHKKIKDLNPITDTQLFLQETENVVSAMQERVTRNLSNNNSSHNSDSDDEATVSHSPAKVMHKSRRPISTRASPLPREASVLSDSGYQVGYQSDSSNEGLRDYANIGAKLNKPFNVRRGRVIGYDSDSCAASALNRHSLTLPVRGISPRPAVGSVPVANSSFGRTDGGRYSLRMPKSRTPPNQMAPPVAKPRASPAPGPRTVSSGSKVDFNANRKSIPQMNNVFAGVNTRKPPTGSRSNSTLTAKEVELANWKRRKSYDPMRAAAEGRKKRETCSAMETTMDDVTPTSLSKHSAAVMSKSMSFQMESNFNSKCNSEEEDMIYVVDEMDSSHSNSPIHIPMSRGVTHDENHYYGHGLPHPALRPKNKLEALDNLVIATIHSLSSKVRTSSRQLLQKLQMQHADNENGALLEEMVSQLKELEISNSSSSPNKSPSRELSGTLKNLKKLEQVILVLDRVLCDDSGSDINT